MMARKRFARTMTVIVFFIMACALSACAGANGSAGSGDAQVSGADEMTTSQALVVYAKDGEVLFADADNGGLYVPTLPEGGVMGLDGEPIDAAELAVGNVVEVDGNGIMLESYPGQYPGITEVRVVEEGSPSDADAYADEVSQLFSEPDPTVVPTAFVDYATPDAQVSLMLDPVSSTWSTAEGEVAVDGSAVDDNGVVLSGTPDARIDADYDATIGFTSEARSVTATCTPLTEQGDALSVDTAAEAQKIPVALTSGAGSLTIEPGYLYQMHVVFESGSADYAFVALKA